MITKGGQLLAMEKIDTTVSEGRMLPMCVGEIPGAECYHLTVPAGNTYTLEADEAHYNIFVLIEGECEMNTADYSASFAERITFVPAPGNCSNHKGMLRTTSSYEPRSS